MVDPGLIRRATAIGAAAVGMALIGIGAAGCEPPAGAGPNAPKAGGAAELPADGPLARYTSKRLGVTVRLPDGAGWTIDDHTRPELVAHHAATRSTLRVAIVRADENVGHDRCEQLARERALLPEGPEQVVEDEVAVTHGDFDTRIRVALQPGRSPDRPLAGHVIAVGGHLRKCFVFAFSTEVDGASEEPTLSSRLAVVRTRVLAAFEIPPLDRVPRSNPGAAADAPR